VGGAAVTRNSTGLPQFGGKLHREPPQPEGDPELRLAERGLRIVERPFSNFLPTADGGYLKAAGARATQREIANSRPATRRGCPPTTTGSSAWPTYCAACFSKHPQRGGGLAELLPAWKAARRLNGSRWKPSATC